MGLFLPLIAIVTGILAASSVVIQKLPDASSLIEKLRPYEAGIGAASLCMSLVTVFNLGKIMQTGSIPFVVTTACVVATFIMGFLLGYPILQGFVFDELSEESRKKSEDLYKKMTPYKITAGLVGISTGLFLLIF
jgi:hypothetical protein